MRIRPNTVSVTEEWFTQLYVEYLPTVRKYLCSIVPSLPDKFELVDDLLQETFYRAWRSRDTLDWTNPKALLIMIAKRLYIDDYRHNKLHPITTLSQLGVLRDTCFGDRADRDPHTFIETIIHNQSPDDNSTPETLYIDKEAFTALLDLVGDALSVRDRNILYLKLQGLQFPQIADVIGGTTKTAIKARWFRLRKVLKKAAIKLSAEWHTTNPDTAWLAFERLLMK